MVAQQTLNLLGGGSTPSPGSGALAHLVERYHDTVEVAGSIPAGPTDPRGCARRTPYLTNLASYGMS